MHVNLDMFMIFILTEVIIAMSSLGMVRTMCLTRVSACNTCWLTKYTLFRIWNQLYPIVFMYLYLDIEINQLSLISIPDKPIILSVFTQCLVKCVYCTIKSTCSWCAQWLVKYLYCVFSSIYRSIRSKLRCLPQHVIPMSNEPKVKVNHVEAIIIYMYAQWKKVCVYIVCMTYLYYILTDVRYYISRPCIVHMEDGSREDSIQHVDAVPASVFATSCRRSSGRFATTTTSDIYRQPAYYLFWQNLLRYVCARQFPITTTGKTSRLSDRAILWQGSRFIAHTDTVSPLRSSFNDIELTDRCVGRNSIKIEKHAVFMQDGQCLFRHILRCCINIAVSVLNFIWYSRIVRKRASPTVVMQDGQCLFRHILRCCINTVDGETLRVCYIVMYFINCVCGYLRIFLLYVTIGDSLIAKVNYEMVILKHFFDMPALARYRYLIEPTDA